MLVACIYLRIQVLTIAEVVIVYLLSASVVSPKPSAAGAGLPLAIKVGGGDRRQVVLLREPSRAEVVAHLRREHRPPPHLAEQHEDHAVNPCRRPRALVADQLSTCARGTPSSSAAAFSCTPHNI